jgi:hypothetical protein
VNPAFDDSTTGKLGGIPKPPGITAVVPESIETCICNILSREGAATPGSADPWTIRRAVARVPQSFFVDFIILQLAFVKKYRARIL